MLDLKQIILEIILPLGSLLLGLLPLTIFYSRSKISVIISFFISLFLAFISTTLIYPEFTTEWNFIWFVLFFIFYFILINRNKIISSLFQIGLYKLYKQKVGILIPSNAIFNEIIINSLKESFSNRFKIIDVFKYRGRTDTKEQNVSDYNYHYYVESLIKKKCKYIVVHIKSDHLTNDDLIKVLRKFIKHGGVVINLITQLDHGLLEDMKGAIYSIRLSYLLGQENLQKQLHNYLKKSDKIILIVAPSTTETSNQRFIYLTSWLSLNKKKYSFKRLTRWSGNEAKIVFQENNLLDLKKRNWIICWNDEIALGVNEYCINKNISKDSVRIIGFDGIPEVKESIKNDDSYIYATVYHKMEEIGILTGDLISNIQSGSQTDHIINVVCSQSDILLRQN